MEKNELHVVASGLTDQRTVAWLIKPVLRFQGNAMALATLRSTAVRYPVLLGKTLAYVVVNRLSDDRRE